MKELNKKIFQKKMNIYFEIYKRKNNCHNRKKTKIKKYKNIFY